MKFIHISDLHFGKMLHGYSMADTDQPFWIERFMELICQEKPDAIVIAGDVYDRSIPSKEAVRLLDKFITRLTDLDIPVFMIAGNHDSGTRLSFASALLQEKKLYIAGEVTKEVANYTLEDEYGPITFWLVPYLFPAAVQEALEDKDINSYDQAMRRLLEEQDLDLSERNVIVSHQMVTDSGKPLETEGSEVMVGGVGNIDVSAYDGFDYVALGHIHAAQKVGRKTVRYSGSPINYHFSEAKRASKGPVIVELKEKGSEPVIRVEELEVLHPMREIKGTYQEIYEQESKNKTDNEYIRVVLTDELVPMDAVRNLSDLFEAKKCVLMETVHEPENRKTIEDIQNNMAVEEISVDELFTAFYREKNNDEFPSEQQQEIIRFVAEQILHVPEDERVNDPAEKDIDALIDFVMGQGV